MSLSTAPTNDLTFNLQSSLSLAGAEISAFDPLSKRLFVTSNAGLQVVDLANPSAPVLLTTVNFSAPGYGFATTDVTSVAVKNGIVAVTLPDADKALPGKVVFLNAADNSLLGSVNVGALPDMITFTPDGTKVLVANEGEYLVNGASGGAGTVSIIDLSGGVSSATVQTAGFTAFDGQEAALRSAGVRIFAGQTASQDVEPEYIAISPDGTKAMVTLQEANAVAILDIASATFTDIVPLGQKNFNGLQIDTSDRDGAGNTALINLQSDQPVFGLYMPDAIDSYQANGQTYYVIANEGDDRDDFLNPDETIRVGSAAYDLDNTVFPNEAALKTNAELGRLTVSNATGLRGDTDGDGDIDQILVYGARSFSILDSTGSIVFDSADIIERIVSTQLTAAIFDDRSDNKGPEPESIEIAKIGSKTYAFLGLERSHMTLAFDVTDPNNVTYTGAAQRAGDLNPEGGIYISPADSPTGKALYVTSNEVSNNISVFEVAVKPYTLQLLHYYGESGLLGTTTAPIMGALIDKFDDQYANTLVLGEGDSFIPGPWLVGGADPSLNAVPGIGSTALGRPDIAIMNAFGTDASALGNHEFDLGSPALQGAVGASGAWVGAQFPFVTANLNFAGDIALRGMADATLGGTATNAFAGEVASAIKGKIAPYTVVTQGGEKIGIVGATTYDLLSKTSPNGTVPKDDGNPSTDDLQEVAAYIQAAVDALSALGVNKIVMLDQLDTVERNELLAPLVHGIDVMVAGGGHERLGDANDTAVGFNGHTADFVDTYPIVTAGSDGKPTLIVTTDTEYTYLGRLVLDFDENGEIILPNLNSVINGAYASTEANLQAAYGTTDSAATIIAGSIIGAKVDAITDAIQSVIAAKDGTVWGYTDVYLEGDRAFGRAQEVNLGNLASDSVAFKGQQALGAGAFVVGLTNGGGIRASIGSIDEDGDKIAPIANPDFGKPAGAISTLDVENALRFDNRLMLFDMTPQGLKDIMEFTAGLSPNGLAQSGGFMQIGGMRVGFDPGEALGSRVKSIALLDLDGHVVARVVENGQVLAGAPATISMVTANFTANGGDGYPIKANAENFRFVLADGTISGAIDESLDFTSAAAFAAAGVTSAQVLGQQQAFKDYLQAFHATPETAYVAPDTLAGEDQRVQNLDLKAIDTVFLGETIVGDAGRDVLNGFAGDDSIYAGDGNDTVNGGDGNDTISGGAGNDRLRGEDGNDTFIVGASDVAPAFAESRFSSGWKWDDGSFEAFFDWHRNKGDGRDIYDGGDGSDTLDFSALTRGIEIELKTSETRFDDDTIINVENIIGTARSDEISGNAQANKLVGAGGDDELDGGKGDDMLDGGDGRDTLIGGVGNDILVGGQGNDILVGGAGADVLSGGAGNDRFDFNAVGDSGVGLVLRDVITDYALGDIIDLDSIDANAGVRGDQDFRDIGAVAFSGAGQLRYTVVGADTLIQGNIGGSNGNTADFEILLQNHTGAVNFNL